MVASFDKRTLLLAAIPFCTIFVMLQNHYTRDTVGALEKQMESDLGLKPSQYSTLNSLYFLPNIVAPLFIGVISEHIKRPATFLLYTAILGAVGNLIFALGAHYNNLNLFYLGRFLAGCVYEVIDTIPIIILGPLFRSNWGLMVGLMNGCLRLGTVMTFGLSPIIYREYGVVSALWASAAMAVLGVVAAYGAHVSDGQLEESNAELALLNEAAEIELEVLEHCTPNANRERKSLIGNRDSIYSVYTNTSQHSQEQALLDPLANTPSTIRESPIRAGTGIGSPPQHQHQYHLPHHHEHLSHMHVPDTMLSPAGTPFCGENLNILKMESHNVVNRRRAGSRVSDCGTIDSVLQTVGVSAQHSGGPLSTLSQQPTEPSLLQRIIAASPVRDFGAQYYFYLFCCMFLFGAIVPFWFIGAKFFQLNYQMEVEKADFLMLLPEGVMVFISPLLGVFLDCLRVTLKYKLVLLGCCLFGMTAAFTMLAYGYTRVSSDGDGNSNSSGVDASLEDTVQVLVDPTFAVLLLSCTYAAANSLTWDVIVSIVPDPEELAPATGLSAGVVNALPCVVPYVIMALCAKYAQQQDTDSESDDSVRDTVMAQSNIGMLVLAATAALGGVAALCSCVCKTREFDTEEDQAAGAGGGNSKETARFLPSARDKTRLSYGSAEEYDII